MPKDGSHCADKLLKTVGRAVLSPPPVNRVWFTTEYTKYTEEKLNPDHIAPAGGWLNSTTSFPTCPPKLMAQEDDWKK